MYYPSVCNDERTSLASSVVERNGTNRSASSLLCPHNMSLYCENAHNGFILFLPFVGIRVWEGWQRWLWAGDQLGRSGFARNIHHDFLLFERLWQCIVRCFERPRSMSRFWICPQSIHDRSHNDIKGMINDHLDERAPCGFQVVTRLGCCMVWARCQLFANTADHVHVPGPAKVSNEDLSLGVEPHCARAQIPKFRV